jgi:hypothetical protein
MALLCIPCYRAIDAPTVQDGTLVHVRHANGTAFYLCPVQIRPHIRRVFSWTRRGLTNDYTNKTGKELTIRVTRREVFGFKLVRFLRDGPQVFPVVDNDHSEGNVRYLWIKVLAGGYDFCDRVKKHGRKVLVEVMRIIVYS